MKDFADKMTERFTSIDILINNAALVSNTLDRTKQGFESNMGVNFVGPSYLTSCLFSALMQSKEARIVNVGSDGYKMGNKMFSKLADGSDDVEDFLLNNLAIENYRSL